MERYRGPNIRVQRRVNLREGPSGVSPELLARGKRISKRTGELQHLLTSSNNVRIETVGSLDRDITAIAYRGDPFVYDSFFALREMHNLLPAIQALNEKGALIAEHPTHSGENDQWGYRFNGLSF